MSNTGWKKKFKSIRNFVFTRKVKKVLTLPETIGKIDVSSEGPFREVSIAGGRAKPLLLSAA